MLRKKGYYKSFKLLERMESVESVKEDTSRGYHFAIPLYSRGRMIFFCHERP